MCYFLERLSKKLQLHCRLQINHQEYKRKTSKFIKIKLRKLKRLQNTIQSQTDSVNENGTFPSNEVAQLIAKSGKSHTITEELIVPAAVAVCKRMLGDPATKLVSSANAPFK